MDGRTRRPDVLLLRPRLPTRLRHLDRRNLAGTYPSPRPSPRRGARESPRRRLEPGTVPPRPWRGEAARNERVSGESALRSGRWARCASLLLIGMVVGLDFPDADL